MTWCRYHCRRCGSHFTSLEAFDAHHGSEPCTLPDHAELVEAPGSCLIGDPTKLTTGTVYGSKRAEKAAEYLRAREGPQPARARRRDPRMLEVVAG